MTTKPRVYLVGAGPGDPELLTVKALRLIQQAEVVVYDRLVSDEILELVPAGTKRIYVGKAPGHHHMGQEAINELLLGLVRSGHRVVRLKGGDPFIFGRGSEEALYLVRHGVDFEVVPGITAAAACSAYAGIPLTHRGLARSVRLITGHCRSNEPLELDWASLADPQTTLVFYMGLANLDQLRQGLIDAGLDAATPAALVEKGTTAAQRRICGTLDRLPQLAREHEFSAPTLVIVGPVVEFADQLDWFSPEQQDYAQQALEI
ncbi:uroporphyrinogen-III C-methyltransferase [Thiohalobacter sp. IOR34]|uniref:uroporphyrinogen-III C-methyltransferase n=1 Tax=Thiohalobacter sp. IOR34 TaxID=3057176 RepID=UPI0025B0D921|nr:uroporphyrinogen-III C-methyltransferase [Thiohalobacter sp. IOR34]WJW75431.1 uroporphyrinogen-III C-methyltransferase [Thiohalobacter sp. IOR34]